MSRLFRLLGRYRSVEKSFELSKAGMGPVQKQELREALGVTGLAAELLKKDLERKAMHEMLSEAGIPEHSNGSGEGICLLGRLAVLIDRYDALVGERNGS